MKQRSTRRDGFGILGIGAAACVACCAGPILAVLGGLGLAGLASTLVIGGAGLLIAAAAGLAFVVVRRGRIAEHQNPVEPVQVAAPTRKVPSP